MTAPAEDVTGKAGSLCPLEALKALLNPPRQRPGLRSDDYFKLNTTRAIVKQARAALASPAAAEMRAAGIMRKALGPFASIADVLDFYVHEACPDGVAFPFDTVRMGDDGPGRVILERKDFESARQALAAARGENT